MANGHGGQFAQCGRPGPPVAPTPSQPHMRRHGQLGTWSRLIRRNNSPGAERVPVETKGRPGARPSLLLWAGPGKVVEKGTDLRTGHVPRFRNSPERGFPRHR